MNMNLADTIRNNGGITLNKDGTEFVANTGYMVSLAGWELIVSANTVNEELQGHFASLSRHAGPDHKIGFWLDNDKIYADISVQVNDLDEAMSLAIVNEQLAIFDLQKMEAIRVK